jgi:hypothetical protein
MMDGLFYLYGNLACNAVATLCALWLLTDRHLNRLLRTCLAFIAAGAVVNVVGMMGALLGFHRVDYGHVWPGEVVTNFGMAVLLGYWVWRSAHRRRASRLPGAATQPKSE